MMRSVRTQACYFALKFFSIQEEREERHKRKKNDSEAGGEGGGYGDLDVPLSGRSSESFFLFVFQV